MGTGTLQLSQINFTITHTACVSLHVASRCIFKLLVGTSTTGCHSNDVY